MANELSIYGSGESFELAQRMAKALAGSTIVPKEYQNNVSNTLIALEMANRLGTSPMMVMQSLYVVNGRPAWSSQYLIAMVNKSGKYKTEMQFDLTGKDDTLACTAWVEDKNGHRLNGPKITMAMASAEGWLKNPKWKTMPEVMIRYRAASFFARLYCPDLIMGIVDQDEAAEMKTEVAANSEDLSFDDQIVVSDAPTEEKKPAATPVTQPVEEEEPEWMR